MSENKSLPPDETVFRYIHPTFVKPNGSISSAAFNDEQLSVDRELLCLRPQPIREGWGTSVLLVEHVNALGFHAFADPQDHNPAHALIPEKESKGQARQFAAMATWRAMPVPPSGLEQG